MHQPDIFDAKLPASPDFLDQLEHKVRLMKLHEPSVVWGHDVTPTQPNAQNLSKHPPKNLPYTCCMVRSPPPKRVAPSQPSPLSR